MSTTKMRPIRETIPLEEALALMTDAATPVVRTERLALHDAGGRVLARDVASERDVPPFDRAAMDGYAVVAEDTFGAGRYQPHVLRCIETVYTGQIPTRTVERGQCIEIATGAPMPAGADAVVMVEETDTGEDDQVRIFTPVYPRQHVGRRDDAERAGVWSRGRHSVSGTVPLHRDQGARTARLTRVRCRVLGPLRAPAWGFGATPRPYKEGRGRPPRPSRILREPRAESLEPPLVRHRQAVLVVTRATHGCGVTTRTGGTPCDSSVSLSDATSPSTAPRTSARTLRMRSSSTPWTSRCWSFGGKS